MFAVSSTKKKIFVRISDFICKQKINEYWFYRKEKNEIF
jgi:hypothetical protein